MSKIGTKFVFILLVLLSIFSFNQELLSPSLVTPVADETSLFTYYDEDIRIRALSEIGRAIEERYALTEQKKYHFGLDAPKVFHTAIKTERAIPIPTTDFQRASANLRFLDRVRSLTAQFQDSHLVARELFSRPLIFNGLTFTKINQHILVHQNASSEAIIKTGDALISIDGIEATQVVENLMSMISSSSFDQRQSEAIRKLTQRNFAYPVQAIQSWQFRTPTGKKYRVRLPWKYEATYNRLDALFYLNTLGFIAQEQPKKKAKPWLNPLHGQKHITLWTKHDSPDPVIRTGSITLENITINTIQLFSFINDTLWHQKEKKESHWSQIAKSFILETKTQKRPLIIDLRFNPGGAIELPSYLLSLIAQPNAVYLPFTEGYRMTQGIIQIWERSREPNKKIDNTDPLSFSFSQAIKQKRAYTGFFNPIPPIRTDADIGGFVQPIIVLTGPNCQSACDLFLAMFKASKRGTIIGQATAGAGSSFLSWQPYDHTRFVDSRFLFKVNIPNSLLGIVGSPGQEYYDHPDVHLSMSLENTPTLPNRVYDETQKDLLFNSIGWLDLSATILKNGNINHHLSH